MTHELQNVHRPKLFKDVIGQSNAVRMLQGFLKEGKLPHALMFVGGSGTGKTTLARILREKLGCSMEDFHEINAADRNGIDTIRDIERKKGLSPLGGKYRVWLIDESHQLSDAAQNGFLKILEDPPKHAYFFLCTTKEEKHILTIRNRCTIVRLETVSDEDLKRLLTSIVTKEKIKISEEVIDRIVSHSGGSPRQAIVLLNSIVFIVGDEDQLKAIVDPEQEREAFDLVRALLWQKPRKKWSEIAKIITQIRNTITKDKMESFRHLILVNASKTLLQANEHQARAFLLLDVFKTPWYGCEESGLIHACYEVVQSKD